MTWQLGATRNRLIFAAKFCVVVAAYYGFAKLGLALAFANSSVTAIWPPTGLALAVLLLWGYRMWPAIALGAFLSNVGAVPLGTVLGMTTGNTLEALTGAYLLNRVGFSSSLGRMRDVVSLVVLAGVLSTIVAATLGVFSLWAGGQVPGGEVASTWRVWWLGDMGGDLLAAPAILVLASRPSIDTRLGRMGEVVVLGGCLLLVSALVFPQQSPLAYAIFPLLFWIALRFGQPGAVVASLLVSGFAIWNTAHGQGPFVGGSPDGDLLRAQTFVGVAAVTALLVAAVRAEREVAETGLEVLADRERQLAEAQALAHVGSWEWDIETDAVSWSDELYRIYGLDKDEFDASYEGFLNLVHPEDQAPVNDAVSQALADHEPFQFVHRLVRCDGEVRMMESRGRVILKGLDGSAKMVGTGQDITALNQAESKFRQLLEFAPDAIIGIGPDGRIELANSQVEQLFGYAREELIGKRIEALVPERYRSTHEGHRVGYFGDPRTRPMGAGLELHALRKDGSEFPCEISLSSIKTEQNMLGVAAVRDVTERKRAEAEAERLKSEFFALVSHELRTPLTSIVGYVDVLAEEEAASLSDRGQDFLGVVKRNSRRLDRLVQDLLLVTQLEAGSFGIDVDTVDVGVLASNLREEAEPAARAAGVRLTIKMSELPPFAGDPTRLTQVLDNLVTNAIKFTPEGGRVDVSIREDGDDCVLEVADTGVGIDREEIGRLFDRFHRSRSASDAQIPGVGLGLAIVKAIVESHNGYVRVESEPGRGSTFQAHVPMRPVTNPNGTNSNTRHRREIAEMR